MNEIDGFNNPPTSDLTILLVVIYYDNRILTIFSWYTDVALPAQYFESLVESFIAITVCSAKAVVLLDSRKQNLVSRMLKTTMGRLAYQNCTLLKYDLEKQQK